MDILSPARSNHEKGRFPKKDIRLNEKVILKLPRSWGTKSRIGKFFVNLYTQLWLFNQLVFKTKKSDKVIVYHSRYVMSVVKMAKAIKRFDLTLEIRELYGDIIQDNDKTKRKELNFFEVADKYVFATNELNEICNPKGKPYILAPGVYKFSDKLSEKFDDGKIHLVYAGNLTKEKGGAYITLNLAEKLSDKYVVHVLGGATKVQLTDFLNTLNSRETLKGKVIYEGAKNGKDFLAFLQKCDVGLSTQKMTGEFNGTSFPSKILTYLTNGLTVFSSRIPVVENSPIGKYVVYYDKENYDEMVKIIENIELKSFEYYKKELDDLQNKLIEDFAKLIEMQGEKR